MGGRRRGGRRKGGWRSASQPTWAHVASLSGAGTTQGVEQMNDRLLGGDRALRPAASDLGSGQ